MCSLANAGMSQDAVRKMAGTPVGRKHLCTTISKCACDCHNIGHVHVESSTCATCNAHRWNMVLISIGHVHVESSTCATCNAHR